MAYELLSLQVMSKGDLNFDSLLAGLVDDENKRKNTIDTDGWDLEEIPNQAKTAAPKRRKVTWIVPTVGAGLVIGGAAVLIFGGWMRPKAVAQENKPSESSFAT